MWIWTTLHNDNIWPCDSADSLNTNGRNDDSLRIDVVMMSNCNGYLLRWERQGLWGLLTKKYRFLSTATLPVHLPYSNKQTSICNRKIEIYINFPTYLEANLAFFECQKPMELNRINPFQHDRKNLHLIDENFPAFCRNSFKSVADRLILRALRQWSESS